MPDQENFRKPGKFLTIAVMGGFVAGMLGSAVTNQFMNGVQTSGAQSGSQEKVVEKRSYVEESQSIDAIKKVAPAVVSIVATQDLKVYYSRSFPFQDPFELDPFGDFPGFQFRVPQQQFPKDGGKEGEDYEVRRQKLGGGTGFIINADGLVLTNRHVVSTKQVEYTIITNDGTEYDGEVVSIDPLNDLAVLQMVKKGELQKKKEERTKLSDLKVVFCSQRAGRRGSQFRQS